VLRYHTHVLHLSGGGVWALVDAADYRFDNETDDEGDAQRVTSPVASVV
jgi:hypothetical protein